MATSEDVAALLHDYDPDEREDGALEIRVSVSDDDDSARTLCEIRALLPRGWTAEWTGGSNTDADGETTSDVLVECTDEDENENEDDAAHETEVQS